MRFRICRALAAALLAGSLSGAQGAQDRVEGASEPVTTGEARRLSGASPQASGIELVSLIRLAEQRYLDGDLDVAARLFREAAGRSGEPAARAQHLVTAAWLEFQLGRLDDASQAMAEALFTLPDFDIQPENYSQAFVDLYRRSRQRALAQLQEECTSRVRSALEEMERGGDLDRARGLLEEALKLHPGDPSALYNLALLDLRQGRDDEAIAGFERLLALQSGRPGSVPSELIARALTNLGVLYYGRSFFEDAERVLVRALDLAPTDVGTWSNLGLARRRLGRRREAREAFERARSLDPNDVQVANNLATQYIDDGNFREAEALLSESTRKQPGEANLWLNLGIAQRGLGNLGGAITSFQRARDLDSNNRLGLAARSATYIAAAHFQRGEHSLASASASEAISLSPNHAEAWIYLGLAQQAGGDVELAEQSFRHALSLDPIRAEIYNNLGSVYFAQRRYREAEEAFQQSLAIRPEFREAVDNLNTVHARQEQIAAWSRDFGASFASSPPVPHEPPKVESTVTDSPADKAGLRPGDVILRADGRKVEDAEDLLAYVFQQAPGRRVALDVMRGAAERQLRIKVF